MKKTKLYIKNMVCPRCIKVVREELEHLGLQVESIILGEVTVNTLPEKLPISKIKNVLLENGFELIDDKNSKLIEKIKKEVISVIQEYEGEDITNINFPQFIATKMNRDYQQLSTIFSKTEGITIEHFIILQKIEKVKEYLKYDELTLSEIAYMLGYSSVQHLSKQFKKNTGLTATQFKDDHSILRKPIDSVN